MALKHKILHGVSFLAYCVALFTIHNLIDPHKTIQLISSYIFAFVPLILFFKNSSGLKAWHLLTIGLVLRFLVFAPPSLSDDYYRYYWDGLLVINNVNPYSILPKQVNLAFEPMVAFNDTLYNALNSPEYYSVYPPFLQLIFAFAAYVGGSLLGFVIMYKSISIAFEIAIFYLLKQLLKQQKLPLKNLILYWLNPLIIIELTGNMHSEIFMLLFTLWAFYLFYKNNFIGLGLAMGLAFLTKLYPVVLIPLFLIPFSLSKTLKLVASFLVTVVLLWIPFYESGIFSHFFESITLYFNKFEFNGSIYNLLKQLGIKFMGYNPIGIVGKLMAGLSIIGFIIIYYLRLKKPLKFGIEKSTYFIIIIFYLLSTTVMPWYLSLIILMSPFVQSNFGLLWSVLIVFTYSAFNNIYFNENPALVAFEYISLAILAIYELRKHLRNNIFELN